MEILIPFFWTSSIGTSPVQDPGPNVPAFSAISRALFRFWSNSSHLKEMMHFCYTQHLCGKQQIGKHAKLITLWIVIVKKKKTQTWWAFLKSRKDSSGRSLSRSHKSFLGGHQYQTVEGLPIQWTLYLQE